MPNDVFTREPAGELSDRDLEAVCAGAGKQSNLPEFSQLNRVRTRMLDEISIHLT